MVPKPRDVQIEVLVVEDSGHALVHNRLQDGDIEHISVVRIYVPADGHFEFAWKWPYWLA